MLRTRNALGWLVSHLDFAGKPVLLPFRRMNLNE